MTPSASPLDPVAALTDLPKRVADLVLEEDRIPPAGWRVQAILDEEVQRLTEQGYVLVNADMLAAALRRLIEGPNWKGTGTIDEYAAEIMAALKGPAR